MAITVTGNVTASTPLNGIVTLTFTDTSSGIGALVSRILTITDCNGNVLDTINMGNSTTATYGISSDMFLKFTEVIIDNTGTYTGVVNYVSIAFYQFTFAPLVAALTSQSDVYGQIYNLNRAELNKNAALDMGLFSQGVNANALIIQANFYLTTPYYA